MERRLVLVGIGRAGALRQLLPQVCDVTPRYEGRIDVALGLWVRRVQARSSAEPAETLREGDRNDAHHVGDRH